MRLHKHTAVATIVSIEHNMHIFAVLRALNLRFELSLLLLGYLAKDVTCPLSLLNEDILQHHVISHVEPDPDVHTLRPQLLVTVFGIALLDIKSTVIVRLERVGARILEPVVGPGGKVALFSSTVGLHGVLEAGNEVVEPRVCIGILLDVLCQALL